MPGTERLHHAFVEGDGRRTRRTREALLETGRGSVDLPLVDRQFHPAERRRRVDEQERAVAPAKRADLVERLGHRRRGVAMHRRDQLGPFAFERVLDPVGREDRAPFGLDDADLRPGALGDLAEKLSESARDGDQHPVARLNHGDQDRLDRRARRAVDQQRPAVLRPPDLPRQSHDLVHVAGEDRIELAQHRHRHRAQDAGIDIDRSRPHQKARRRIEISEQFRHAVTLSRSWVVPTGGDSLIRPAPQRLRVAKRRALG